MDLINKLLSLLLEQVFTSAINQRNMNQYMNNTLCIEFTTVCWPAIMKLNNSILTKFTLFKGFPKTNTVRNLCKTHNIYLGNHLACSTQGSSPDSQHRRPPSQQKHFTSSLRPEMQCGTVERGTGGSTLAFWR